MCSHFGFVILFPFFYAAAANNDDSSIWMRAFTDWCLRRNGSKKSFQMNSFIVLVLFLQSMKINETTWKPREMTSSLLGEISLKKEKKRCAKKRDIEKRPSLELECVYVVNALDDCKSEVAKQSIVWIPLEFCTHKAKHTKTDWVRAIHCDDSNKSWTQRERKQLIHPSHCN